MNPNTDPKDLPLILAIVLALTGQHIDMHHACTERSNGGFAFDISIAKNWNKPRTKPETGMTATKLYWLYS